MPRSATLPTGATANRAFESPSERFDRLLEQWRNECRYVSASDDLILHPAYQQIIGMGPPAVPLLLEELKRQPDLLFWALVAITGEDPVPADGKGNLELMAATWLDWGRRNGHVA